MKPKILIMKAQRKTVYITALLLLAVAITLYAIPKAIKHPQRTVQQGSNTTAIDSPKTEVAKEKGCVFRTVFGEEPCDSDFIYKTPQNVAKSQTDALKYLAGAQNSDGGWGAGSHARQNVMDPHAVSSDPASTAMVAMAMLRCRNTPTEGQYSNHLNKALNYLLASVEASDNNALNITNLQSTQPQVKLGQNIDVVLTSQFLTNILDYVKHDKQLQARVEKNLNKCISKIQRGQSKDGSFQGSGWAGVLQSSLANNALETAQSKGMKVDTVVLENSRSFQKGNVDAKTGDVKTEMGAGVVLYSVSSASRASAKEARVAKEQIEVAKKNGTLAEKEEITVENLRKTGMTEGDAMKYKTAYDVNESAKQQSVRDDVMKALATMVAKSF